MTKHEHQGGEMKLTYTALVAVILSTMSGASLAALPEGHTNTVPPSVTTSYVTGSTTLVSLDVQLSGTPAAPAVRPLALSTVSGANSLYGTTISYH
jgi:multiple stress resistance protein BhsA